jgi:hypothetical protein
MDRTGLATKSTSLQGSGCLSTQPSKESRGACVSTKDSADERAQIETTIDRNPRANGEITDIEVSAQLQVAGLHVGGKSEDVARQTGEQEKVVRTHCVSVIE